ncbi:MAG: hypothetical protein OM95_13405 [Bdellovibrio sp. ArHS]|uniref:translocation/assembly module TamB domain-containing protein n=1 Tax=Bdellovibrio sp. ArHS TaxID=1569284 RepID=UPI0005824867|nr:translocation/assembly module TamB domain-containing protein [Bdellovibrio sp. ArHS]KHD87585.1 MAG: hypothetical protein OM95_13405 [Bdellovibrio sp. ArHS]
MKKFLLFLMGFVLLILAAFAGLWMNLDWILNEKNLRRVVDKTQIQMTWKNFELQIQNKGLTAKSLSLEATDLCFKYPQPVVDICAQKIHLSFYAGLTTQRPFVQIRNLNLKAFSDHIVVIIPESTETKPAEPFQWPALQFASLDSFLSRYLALLPKEAVESLALEIQDAKISLLPSTDFTVSTTAHSQGSAVTLKTELAMQVNRNLLVQGAMQSSLRLSTPTELQIEGQFEVPSLGLKTALRLSWLDRLQVTLRTLMKHQKMTLSSELQAELKQELWTLALKADLQEPRWPFQRLSVKKCDVKIQIAKGLPIDLNWPCLLEAHKIRKTRLKGLPESLALSSLIRSPIRLEKDILHLRPQIQWRMQEPTLIDLSVDSSASATLNLTRKSLQQLKVETLQALLKVPALENWQRLLVKSAYSLPAPLHVLKGDLQLQIEGPPTEVLSKLFDVNASLTTNLTSPRQALKTTSQLQLTADFRKPLFTLQGDIGLTEVTFELPYLGFETPPQFKPDARFVKQPTLAPRSPKAPSSFAIQNLHIHTDATPVRLRTRLLEEPIPLHINYKLRDSKSLSGTVSVGKMNVEIFKKKAAVDRFILKKYPDSTVQDLDGLLIHRTSEVKIEILIVGTTEKPRIELLSDPPLSRQQIISILLFNKSLQQLADEDKNTAGQLDQALLSEAFGLASLFLLSSTPIESVYFDPRTQSYTARVRLDDQTSVSLGSNFETSQQFTVRRRLGGPWSLSTELKQSDNTEDVITTLIEWFKRF